MNLSMSEATAFAVILTRPEQREPMVLARALASIRKTPVQDQVMPAKSGWGIVAENLNAEEARRLVEGLSQAGLESKAVPALSPLPPAQALTRWDPAILDELALIAAAGITVTSTTTKSVKEGPSAAQKILNTGILLTTGLPIKIGGKERTVQKTQQHSDLVFYLDLIGKDPRHRWRVEAEHFDYSFLKERKLYFLMGNFKLLVGDFVQAAPAAWRNHGARVLLENKPVQTMGYDSLTDLERETRWLLTLQSSRAL
jgi:hypothetical protein